MSAYSLAEENCPVGDKMLGDLYRSHERGLADLVATVAPDVRATLALFCYRRGHLHSMGLAIAASCTEDELEHAGGRVGLALFALSREAPQAPRLAPYVEPAQDHAGQRAAQGDAPLETTATTRLDPEGSVQRLSPLVAGGPAFFVFERTRLDAFALRGFRRRARICDRPPCTPPGMPWLCRRMVSGRSWFLAMQSMMQACGCACAMPPKSASTNNSAIRISRSLLAPTCFSRGNVSRSECR